MDATIMPSTASLLKQLRHDHPAFELVESDTFLWSPDTRTLSIDTSSPDFAHFALHELGHALLGHQSYSRDIDLIKIERDAWNYAALELAPKYNLIIDEGIIQDNLDTYREWLHARSLCPSCQMTGLQSGHEAYTCLACGCRWKTNEARSCALRRYTVSH
jgi:hypothetical protein